MLKQQIEALSLKETEVMDKIVGIEEELKKEKANLAVIKRAKKTLEQAEETLNGQTVVSAQ